MSDAAHPIDPPALPGPGAFRPDATAPAPLPGAIGAQLTRWSGPVGRIRDDFVAEETPIAFEINGIAHAVMMASPRDLEDFAAGFCLSEGLVDTAADLYDLEVDAPGASGITVRIEIASRCFVRLQGRRRAMAGRTGCGVCGTEQLEQAVRLPPALEPAHVHPVPAVSIERALAELPRHQPLAAQTGACHAAAWCDATGEPLLIREDVGRHNALDKLLGAIARARIADRSGFILMSSRASHELVQKCVLARFSTLVAVSAPTSLAIDLARRCGLCLIAFARPGRWGVYTFPERVS